MTPNHRLGLLYAALRIDTADFNGNFGPSEFNEAVGVEALVAKLARLYPGTTKSGDVKCVPFVGILRVGRPYAREDRNGHVSLEYKCYPVLHDPLNHGL